MIEKIKEKWDEILLHIKEEHELTDVSFKTWLLPFLPIQTGELRNSPGYFLAYLSLSHIR